MTTTTFTAPLILCWAQIKILRWLLFILVATFTCQFIGSTLSNPLVIASSVYSVVLLTLSAFFVGPVVFGGEHHAGASDYLRTRPVSPRLVFTIKILFVASICLACAYGVSLAFGTNRPIETILYSSLFLAIGFWTSAVTILSKDIVRGLLVGSVSFIGGILVLIYILEDVFHLIDNDISGRFGITGEYFTLHLLAISPLIFFAIVSTTDRWSRLGKVSLSLTSVLALSLFTMNCFLPAAYNRVEGNLSWESDSDRMKYVLAARRDGEQILSVEGLQSHREPKLSLVSREFDGQSFHVTLSSPLPEPVGNPNFRASFIEDRLVVFDHAGLHLTIYNIGDLNDPAIIRTYSSEEASYFPVATHLDNLLIREHREAKSIPDATQMSMIDPPINILYRLNPKHGSLEEIAPIDLEEFRAAGTNRLLFGDDSPFHLAYRDFYKYSIARDVESGTVVVAEFEGTVLASISRNLLVAFAYQSQQLKEQIPYSHLFLIDVSDPENPGVVEIDVPLRLALPHNVIDRIQKVYGDLARTFKTRLQCHRAGDYLLVQSKHGRFGVWDLSQVKEPKFLGLSYGDINSIVSDTFGYGRYADSYTPFRRHDGAIGFFTNSAEILWLEFPALMKEAKKS